MKVFVIQRRDTNEFYCTKRSQNWKFKSWDDPGRWAADFDKARLYGRRSDAGLSVSSEIPEEKRGLIWIRECTVTLDDAVFFMVTRNE